MRLQRIFIEQWGNGARIAENKIAQYHRKQSEQYSPGILPIGARIAEIAQEGVNYAKGTFCEVSTVRDHAIPRNITGTHGLLPRERSPGSDPAHMQTATGHGGESEIDD